MTRRMRMKEEEPGGCCHRLLPPLFMPKGNLLSLKSLAPQYAVVLLGLVHSTGNGLLSVFELRCCRLAVCVPGSTACRDNARCYSLWDACPLGYRTTHPTPSQPALRRWGGQGRGQGDCSFPLRHFCSTS